MPDPAGGDNLVTMLTGKTAPDAGPDRILIVAIDLFYRNGFSAVTLQQILDEAGVSEADFNQNFLDLPDLIVQAIRQHDQWERDAWIRALHELAPNNPTGQLLAMWDFMEKVFQNPDYKGCLFINAASEFPDPSHPAHLAAMDHKHEVRRWIQQIADQAHIPDPKRFAYEYITLFEGTLIMRQAHQDANAARLTKPMVQRLIQDHLGQTSPS